MASWSGCFASPGIDPKQDVATFQCLEPLFKNLATSLFELAGVALFVFLLYGGFTYLISGGDQKKLEQAKGTITSAIIGIVIMVVAFLIVKTIGIFTGTETQILNFTIPR